MELVFSNRRTQRLLSEKKKLQAEFTPIVAKAIQQRMNELRAAEHLGEISHLPPMRLHKLTGDRAGQLSVSAKEKYRIVFWPLDEDEEKVRDPEYPREQITKLLIIEVVNYHV